MHNVRWWVFLPLWTFLSLVGLLAASFPLEGAMQLGQLGSWGHTPFERPSDVIFATLMFFLVGVCIGGAQAIAIAQAVLWAEYWLALTGFGTALGGLVGVLAIRATPGGPPHLFFALLVFTGVLLPPALGQAWFLSRITSLGWLWVPWTMSTGAAAVLAAGLIEPWVGCSIFALISALPLALLLDYQSPWGERNDSELSL